MLVVVDLGNTRLKLGAFDAGRLVAVEAFEGGRDIASGAIPFPHLFGADTVVVGASSPGQLRTFREQVRRPFRVLDAAVVAAVATSYEDPAELGIDRLAAAWGGRALLGAARVVAVDVGTALTVDALDAHGRFLAVAIAPGPLAAGEGLRRAAPHLPLPAGPEPPRLPAAGTADSLRNGAALAAAGAVERLVEEAQALIGGNAPVALTGGGAARVAPLLRIEHRVLRDCVLHGLLALHEAVPE